MTAANAPVAANATTTKRRTSRLAQLGQLRELVWYFLRKEKPHCCFCYKPLVDPYFMADLRLGRREHLPPLPEPLTLHHPNRDRDNPQAELKLAHRRCHKSHEMKLRHAAKRDKEDPLL